MEMGIVFICFNVFLVLFYTYSVNNNLKNLFVATNFLFAGLVNLGHAILVFKRFHLAYYSISHLFALSSRLLVIVAILISWWISEDRKSRYSFYILILTTIFYSIGSLILVFKLWIEFAGIIIVIRAVLLIGLLANIIYYLADYKNNKKHTDLLLKGFIFTLCNELILLFKANIFGTGYFVAHIFKLVAFVYFFRHIFGEEVTSGILAQKEVKIKNAKLNYQQRMIKELRSQRHDFKNELQTIYTMLQLNKLKQAREYIKNTHLDLSETVGTKSYDNRLAPVLLCKEKIATENDIQLETEIKYQTDKIAIPYNKFIKILFNLIDNAFDAVRERKENRKVQVELFTKRNNVILKVFNNGPIIPNEIKEDIFTPGYTTKDKGSGFGLHIIKSTIEDYGGSISVKSKEEFGTEFICWFPKSEKNIDSSISV
ncbi:sensor histidine kinase [Halobacteroides halobius]|nr:ATP-binding protein [Halobacteroides halobius]